MGLVISTFGVIQSSKARKVVSQIKPDVLALLDVRYYLNSHAVGSDFGPVEVHGNGTHDYRYFRLGTNENNPNAPTVATDGSLRFNGNSTLRTEVFPKIEIEHTIAMVLKIDTDSVGGMFFRLADNTDSTSSKNILYSVNTKNIKLRAGVVDLISLPFEAKNHSEYLPIIVSFSKNKTIMIIGESGIIDGPAAPLAANYLQLMSADHATDKVSGNLKYFSWYNGAATADEMYKLHQTLISNFNI